MAIYSPSIPQEARPAGKRPAHGSDRDRAVIALLAGLLVLALLGHAVPAVVRALPPQIEYVTTETVYAGGRPVEWRVELRIREETVVASFWSEREQIRLADELTGSRGK